MPIIAEMFGLELRTDTSYRPGVTLHQSSVRPSVKKWLRNILVSLIVVAALSFTLISILQDADSGTIIIAKEVDAFIINYCETNKCLPTRVVLQTQFPSLDWESGWFLFTDELTYLKVQYPMRWWNKDAIGEPRVSEFTATVASYVIEYHCAQVKNPIRK